MQLYIKKGYAAVLHPTVTSSLTPKNSLRADNTVCCSTTAPPAVQLYICANSSGVLGGRNGNRKKNKCIML